VWGNLGGRWGGGGGGGYFDARKKKTLSLGSEEKGRWELFAASFGRGRLGAEFNREGWSEPRWERVGGGKWGGGSA